MIQERSKAMKRQKTEVEEEGRYHRMGEVKIPQDRRSEDTIGQEKILQDRISQIMIGKDWILKGGMECDKIR